MVAVMAIRLQDCRPGGRDYSDCGYGTYFIREFMFSTLTRSEKKEMLKETIL